MYHLASTVMATWRHCNVSITFKRLGHFFQNVILFSNSVHHKCTIVWNWTNAMNVWSALWLLMAWCFSTRPSPITDGHPEKKKTSGMRKENISWLHYGTWFCFAVLCCGYTICQWFLGNIWPYSSGLPHWQWRYRMIAQEAMNNLWYIWLNGLVIHQ